MIHGVVFVDLDSTLADTTHRHHLIDPDDWEATDWEAYSLACADDVPFEGPCELVRMLFRQYLIVIVTSRSEVARELTLTWLYRHRIPFNEVIMRSRDDGSTLDGFKLHAIHRWLDTNPYDLHVPSLVIEDWPASYAPLAAEGWPVLMVNPMYVKEEV